MICTRIGQGNRVPCFKNPQHKSFLYGGVCPFVCEHHDPGFYSCTGDWVNEIACLHREARVPEDQKRPRHLRFPVTWLRVSQETRNLNSPPWLLLPAPPTFCSKYTSWQEKRLNTGQILQRQADLISEPMTGRVGRETICTVAKV